MSSQLSISIQPITDKIGLLPQNGTHYRTLSFMESTLELHFQRSAILTSQDSSNHFAIRPQLPY